MNALMSHGVSRPDIDSFIQRLYTTTDDVGTIFEIAKCGVLAIRKRRESEWKRVKN